MATSYKAVYQGKKSGPRIAMLAEYDALPEIGHACGHNLIAMMSVGSGIAMREFADEYGAEITVIGTPAEETAGGKVEMSRKGAFKGYDAVMMAHPYQGSGSSINTTVSYTHLGRVVDGNGNIHRIDNRSLLRFVSRAAGQQK